MLLSGRWFLLSICLFLSGSALAATPKAKVIAHADTRSADLAAEQQRAFQLSSSGRVMPSEEWFLHSEYDRDSEGAIKSRWISDPYKVKK